MTKQKKNTVKKDSVVEQFHNVMTDREYIIHRTLNLYCANTPALFRLSKRIMFILNDVHNGAVRAIWNNLAEYGELIKDKNEEEIQKIRAEFKFLTPEEYSREYTKQKNKRALEKFQEIIDQDGKVNWYRIGDYVLPRTMITDQIKIAFANHERAKQNGNRVQFRPFSKMKSFGFPQLNGVDISFCSETGQVSVSFDANLSKTFDNKLLNVAADTNSAYRRILSKQWEELGIIIPRKPAVFKSKIIKAQKDYVLSNLNAGTIYNARIVKTNGKFSIHIGVKFPAKTNKELLHEAMQSPEITKAKTVGMDVGITHPYMLSDGKFIKNNGETKKLGKEVDIMNRRISKLAKQIEDSKRGSEKYLKRLKRNRRIKTTHIADKRKYNAHCYSRHLTNDNPIIACEALELKRMAETGPKNWRKRSLNRWMRDVSPGMFLAMLAYKMEAQGHLLIKVDPRNTSQECSNCGTIVKKDVYVREHNCPSCGLIMERDLNAAHNIKKRGLEKIEEILNFKQLLDAGDETAISKYNAYLKITQQNKVGGFRDMHKRKSAKENAGLNGIEIPQGIEMPVGCSTDVSQGMSNHSGRCEDIPEGMLELKYMYKNPLQDVFCNRNANCQPVQCWH